MTTKRKRPVPGATTSWIQLATEKRPECAVPVSGKMFQADIPPILTGNCQDPDSSKWLGNQVWPPQESSNDPTQDNKEEVIGKGRESCTCTCQSPGSVECVNLHVSEERNRLRTELGPAFEEWGFHQIGEGAHEGWSQREENKFEEMMERKPGSQKVKVELFDKYFRNKDGTAIVNYFYNVYCPRKFARRTRAGCKEVGTDDDDEEEEKNDDDEEDNYPSNSQTPQKGIKSETAADKRSKSQKCESSEPNKNPPSKNKYMAGFR